MRDSDCVAFLQVSLPRLGLRWRGYRKVRRTVCKRIARRLRELGLRDLDAYQAYLADHAEEWQRLDTFCRIPISRFWRDRALFDWLAETAFPALAATAAHRDDPVVRCWSAGCASGEEAYSLRLAWAQHAEAAWPSTRIEITATDADETMVARAQAGRYSAGSVRELAPSVRESVFDRDDDEFILRDEAKQGVMIALQDLRKAWPDGFFDVIACRNCVFTYFSAERQRHSLNRLTQRLAPGGLLIIGGHERLPDDKGRFAPAANGLPVYRLAAAS